MKFIFIILAVVLFVFFLFLEMLHFRIYKIDESMTLDQTYVRINSIMMQLSRVSTETCSFALGFVLSLYVLNNGVDIWTGFTGAFGLMFVWSLCNYIQLRYSYRKCMQVLHEKERDEE